MLGKLFRKKSYKDIVKEAESSTLKRSLGAFQLTMLGIGAIIGTGIFVLTGKAAHGTEHALGAGPAITISFMLTAFACVFAALCYAEFASMIPISGSAYTYAYSSFGELIAWIIGWDLVLEYAVGNVAVAIGWSSYFKSFLDGWGIHLPGYISSATGTDMRLLPTGAWAANTQALIAKYGTEAVNAMPHQTALFNLPAFVIVFLITALLVKGIKESANATSVLVIAKLVLIGAFILFGMPHFKPETYWEPFMPNGWGGVISGAALVFFAYVGFDAVSTTAEEAKNPQRDLPIGMIASLVICTILYIIVSGLLTGMVPLSVLDSGEPVAAALRAVGENKIAMLIAGGVTFTIPSVLLVLQLGQVRVFYSMSRDGLLPSVFSKVHQTFQTPAFSTIIVGLLVAVLAALIDIGEAAELCNIGTLFAFVLVAIGIWILRVQQPEIPRKFKIPFFKIACTLCVLSCGALMYILPWMTWVRFFVWMAIGFVIYFAYGINNSKLNKNS